MDPVTATLVIAAIGGVTTITRTWARARRRRPANELRAGRAYRLPPKGRIRDLGGRWVTVEGAGRDGLPDDLR
jgi:hypothetical protein